MDKIETVYGHKSTGLILLALGVGIWLVGAAANGLDIDDLRNFGGMVTLLAGTRITHQMWGSHISTAYRVGRVERRRASVVAFPGRGGSAE